MKKYVITGLLAVAVGAFGVWFFGFRNQQSVQAFDFSVSSLQACVSGTDRKKLDLAHKNIQSLPVNLSEKLKPVVDLEHDPVRVIDLSHNNISGTLEEGTFAWLTKPTSILLKNNNLTAVDQGAFNNLQSLETIDLSHNMISDLKGDTFKHLTGLWTLDLSHNELTFLNEDALDDLRLLHVVSFANNKITMLQSNMFADVRPEIDDAQGKVSNLEHIDFSGNPITKVENNALAELPNLRTLIISKDLSSDVIQIIKAQAYNANAKCDIQLV